MPQPKTLEQRQAEQLERIDKLKHDYEVVFATESGKRVLSDITLSCGVLKEVFSSDAMLMAYKEGKRAIGLHIIEMAKTDSLNLKKPAPAYRG